MKTEVETSRNAFLSGTISDFQGLVDELLGLPASDLNFDTGALVHLNVWFLGFLQSSYLGFDGLN